MKYIYPALSNIDLGFIRIGGAGLANCMYVAARAYSYSLRYNAIMIEPTWEKLSIGPILRGEKDKRHYIGLFSKPFVKGFNKISQIYKKPYHEFEIDSFLSSDSAILKVSGLGNYFQDLDQKESKEYFDMIISNDIKGIVGSENFEDAVAVHVRLGDYSTNQRTPISWYEGVVECVRKINDKLKFYVFSDGSDNELRSLLLQPNVERRFYGNALADMLAISKCRLVIASDSTFSAWGAFLGNVPIIFPKRHFPPVYKNNSVMELVSENTELTAELSELLSPL